MEILGQLRRAFQGNPDVRIAYDARTAQLLVNGPESCQLQVSKYLANLLPPTRPFQTATTPAPHSTPALQNIVLRNISARQLVQELRSVVGHRLSIISGPTREPNRFYLAMAGQGGAELRLDFATNRVTVHGPPQALKAAARLVQVLDGAREGGAGETRLVPFQTTRPETWKKMAEAVQGGQAARAVYLPVAMKIFGGNVERAPSSSQAARPSADRGTVPPERNRWLAQVQQGVNPPPPTAPEGAPAGEEDQEEPGGLIGSVQIEMLEGLDVLVIRGRRSDVEQVMQIIEQIEKLSTETEPQIVVYPLRHTNSQAMAEMVQRLYEEVYLSRQGSVSITALIKPNALLVIGRKENVQTALNLVQKMDQPAPPEAEFRIFRLRRATASDVADTINEFYYGEGGQGDQQGEKGVRSGGLSLRVRVVADSRTNSLIVQAAPRDLEEIAALVAKLDTGSSEAVNELRIIRLQHALAEELAEILREAIGGPSASAPARPGAARPRTATTPQRSAILRFLTLDDKERRLLQSGILSDVRITADAKANAILLSAPAESIDLLEALIRQLDRLPGAEAQIKVFPVVNGDAAALVEMLQLVFGQPTAGGAGRGGTVGMTPFGIPFVTAGTEGESTLVPLRFAVDTRTNSIIATGSMGDLNVVEAIIVRLDGVDVRNRQHKVYRLKNAPAADVAQAINEFLRSERQVQQLAPEMTSPFEQIEREVVVVPELVNNSLIISATPRFYEEIINLVKELDKPPPMVMIQVLIAEVALNDTDELGVELGLQDSILFDRSILSDIVTTTSTTFNEVGQPTSENQTIVAADNRPGFLFNNEPLGNSGSTQATQRSNLLGGQGLSHFAMGRVNNDLGYGGFVFSASNESVSVLIRALKECRRLDVLSRPQVMTLDNQPAFILVGQRVPLITGVQTNQSGQSNQINYQNVGLILGVTPRISPDGLVVMEIDAEKSDVGPEAEGIPVYISEGQTVRQPRINTTTAQTTISASNGQTVVLGGLISKSKSEFHRKVPGLGDIPVLGHLFRYDGTLERRTELLIIMTPHIVRNEADAESIKRVEASRMNWCLSDVIALHGSDDALRRRDGPWGDQETHVVYPDLDPQAPQVYPPLETQGDSKVEPITTPPAVPKTSPQYVPPGPWNSPSPSLPPEPPAFPATNETGLQRPRPLRRAVEGAPPTVPAAADVRPTLYDAPPQYPTTQTSFYR